MKQTSNTGLAVSTGHSGHGHRALGNIRNNGGPINRPGDAMLWRDGIYRGYDMINDGTML